MLDTAHVSAGGRPLDLSPKAFGELRRSEPGDAHRLAEDGYLFVPGLLDRAKVEAARAELLAQEELAQDYAMGSERMRSVLQGERMMGFFAGLFGAPARSYDFIWLRAQDPGDPATLPHCDLVFMTGRTMDEYQAMVTRVHGLAAKYDRRVRPATMVYMIMAESDAAAQATVDWAESEVDREACPTPLWGSSRGCAGSRRFRRGD